MFRELFMLGSGLLFSIPGAPNQGLYQLWVLFRAPPTVRDPN